jgi:methylase of polypeptide subunit release factors
MKEEVMGELRAEPELAFFDREGGFYFHKQIIESASKYLKEGGSLFLEFDITQRKGIEELIRNSGFKVYSFLLDPYYHECAVMVEKR